MAKEEKKEDLFDKGNEVQSPWVKWGKEGDFVRGTLIAVREMTSKLPGKEGQKVPVYEIKADAGEFHVVDEKTKLPVEPAVSINEGEIYNLEGRPIVERQMRNIKLGTKIGLKYTETQPPRNKGFNPLKVIKVYIARGQDNKPIMDEEWLKERASADALENF